jgi:hypothetical protein
MTRRATLLGAPLLAFIPALSGASAFLPTSWRVALVVGLLAAIVGCLISATVLRSWRVLVIVPVVVGAFYLEEIGLALMLLGALVGCPIFAVNVLVQRKREVVVRLGTVILLALASWASLNVFFHLRRYGAQRTAERAEVVIEALERYRFNEGEYPESLGQLVPAYLTEIPSTGMSLYPQFEYVPPLRESAKEESARLFQTYELSVHLFELLQYDRFVYWPEGGYPELMYSGGVERIGAWAYLHE